MKKSEQKEHLIDMMKGDEELGLYQTEVIRVYQQFFKETKSKQRRALRIFIWWSIKHYFTTLFKR